jgi:carbon-monoxide dehydrogenase small subunit
MLATRPEATRQEVREAIGGNLCRCTGYHKIVDAALAAARRLVEGRPAPQADGRPINQPGDRG